ncbi:unnamed protein product [Ectocarpus sp. CCAP 1310/34]|nr:unnamed protein product [Ectocarpus sp. CCAP 1310/34]
MSGADVAAEAADVTTSTQGRVDNLESKVSGLPDEVQQLAGLLRSALGKLEKEGESGGAGVGAVVTGDAPTRGTQEGAPQNEGITPPSDPAVGPGGGRDRGSLPQGETTETYGGGTGGFGGFVGEGDGFHQNPYSKMRVSVHAPRLEGGQGYCSWRRAFIQAAKTVDMDGQFVGATEPQPDVGDMNKPKATLLAEGYSEAQIHRSLQAFHFLSSALVREPDKAVFGRCVTPKQALDELDKVHNPESQVATQELLSKFQNFAMPADKNPTESLIAMEQLASRLNERGVKVEASFVLSLFLSALPAEYDHAKLTLQSAPTLDRGEVIRVGLLVSADNGSGGKAGRNRGRGGRGGGGNGENGGSGNGNGNGGGDGSSYGGRRRGRCYRCKRRGHQSFSCTTPIADFMTQCENCDGYGHDKSKCPSAKDEEEAKGETAVMAVAVASDDEELDVAREAL